MLNFSVVTCEGRDWLSGQDGLLKSPNWGADQGGGGADQARRSPDRSGPRQIKGVEMGLTETERVEGAEIDRGSWDVSDWGRREQIEAEESRLMSRRAWLFLEMPSRPSLKETDRIGAKERLFMEVSSWPSLKETDRIGAEESRLGSKESRRGLKPRRTGRSWDTSRPRWA